MAISEPSAASGRGDQRDRRLSRGRIQADRRFRIAEMGPLMTCLEAARNAGRVCVITSDHGHVVEYEVDYRTTGGRAERWRPAGDRLDEGEIVLSRRRVLAGGGTSRRAMDGTVRYRAGRSAGYHGGATPQEMLVPVAVLAPRGAEVPGWRAAASAVPEWWDEDVPHEAVVPVLPTAPTTLLDPRLAEPEWIERLLASAPYATQRERHARVAPDDARVQRLLSFLATRGDRATVGALAQALELPEHRARGVIAGLRRVLAVDGFDVLVVASEDVTLDRHLLLRQFGLASASTS